MITGGQQVSFLVDANLNQYVEQGAGAPPGTLKELVNLRKDRHGKLVKRQGYSGTVQRLTTPAAVRGFEHEQTSVLIDESRVLQYSAQKDVWNVLDRAPMFTLEEARPLQGDSSGWFSDREAAQLSVVTGYRQYPACAVGGGIVVHVWVYKEWGLGQTGTYNFPNPQQDRHGVYLAVLDEQTGAVLRAPQRVSGVASSTNIYNLARVTYSNGNFWIIWSLIPAVAGGAVTTPGYINGLCHTTAQLADPTYTIPAATTLKSDLMCSGNFGGTDPHNSTFDISSHILPAGGGTKCFVAYTKDAGAGVRSVAVFDVSTSLTVTYTNTINATAGRAVSIGSVPGVVWVAWVPFLTAAQTVIVAKISDSNLSTVGTGTTFIGTPLVSGEEYVSTGICVPTAGTTIMLTANAQEGAVKNQGAMVWGYVTAVASVPTLISDELIRRDVVASSQSFLVGNEFMVWSDFGGHGDDYTSSTVTPTAAEWIAMGSTVLLPLTHDTSTVYTGAQNVTTMPHMRVAAGKTNWGQYADVWFSTAFASCHAPQKVWRGTVDTDLYYWDGSVILLPMAQFLGDAHNTGFGATGAVAYTLRATKTQKSPAHVVDYANGLSLHSGGGMLYQFDGAQYTEVGFLHPPRIDSVTEAINGHIAAGDYVYALVYEYTDARGNIHQSAPWVEPFTVTGADKKVTFTVRCLNVTTKQDIENEARGTVTTGVPNSATQIALYRSLAGESSVLYRVGTVINAHASTNTVDIIDYAADATIAAGPILYTTTGEVVNEMPPAAYHAVAFNNRIALIDAEYRDRIVFSKPLRLGQGPAFSGVLETYVREIGKLTALAAMDGTLYAFSANAVAIAAYGDGQDATATGSWPQPQVISRAAGCIDPRALCVTQDGIIFCCKESDSTRRRFSIWLLPRGGGNVIEISRAVQSYMDGRGGAVALFSLGPSPAYAASPPTDVLSCVNWVPESRVMITVRYTNTVTLQLEYDYGNRGEDGIGVWSVSHVVAGLFQIGCAWTARDQHWLGDSTTNGNVLRSVATASNDTAYTGATAVWIPYVVEWHAIKLGSLAPRGKLNFINVEFATDYNSDNPGTTQTQWTVYGDTSAPVTATIAVDAYDQAVPRNWFELRARREWQPPVRRDDLGAGITLRIESLNTSTSEAIPLLVHIDYIANKGLRRMAAGQRV